MNEFTRKVEVRNTVTVYVRGGLGNQLCSYAAGWLVAKEVGTSLFCSRVVVDRSTDPGRRFLLDNFDWDPSPPGLPKVYFESRDRRALQRGAQVISRRLKLRFGKPLGLSIRTHRDDFLAPLEEGERHVVLEGHFEDLTLVRKAISSGLPLPLRSRAFAMPGEPSSNDVVIHIRLGDYKSWMSGSMLLKPEDYANALKALSARGVAIGDIHLFSDEPMEARLMLERAGVSRRHIQIDENTEPTSCLMTLARYPYKILSRSTTGLSTT